MVFFFLLSYVEILTWGGLLKLNFAACKVYQVTVYSISLYMLIITFNMIFFFFSDYCIFTKSKEIKLLN
jgi:hypothetical protein